MSRKTMIMDGNNAAAWAAYPFTEVAAVYPITPSTPMSEITERRAAAGQTNIFGSSVKVAQMQSEAGSAGAVHGSLSAGALTTTFTSSQGLLLMIPDMYKIAGELLPCVIHAAARSVASHALSIFGDHSDIYACRQTGFAMLCSADAQEAADLGVCAHLSAIKGSVPFLHFFDGFRTSHEIQKINVFEKEDISQMLDFDAVEKFRRRALSPDRPTARGTSQTPDIFFQQREAANRLYDELPKIVEGYMNRINEKASTNYRLFNYYGAPNATHVIVAMGSVCNTIEETIDYLNANECTKLGLVKVHLYRPFCADKLIDALPDSVEQVSVLDRTKEPGALGEPLWLDVCTALKGTKFHDVPVTSGRYGLGSKDVTPEQIKAVFWNASWKESYKPKFTVGINDDVTMLSLKPQPQVNSSPKDVISCRFFGLGADGTIGAAKSTIKIIGENTDLNVQAYFSYDSKKSGGITTADLRFGKSKIKSAYLIEQADFVGCHNESYLDKFDIVSSIKPGGVFLLNTPLTAEQLGQKLPGQVKRYIAQNGIRFYTVDAGGIAKRLGLGQRVNTILQSAFFKLSEVIPFEKACELMKNAAAEAYSRKGEEVVKMNLEAIDEGCREIVRVEPPEEWKHAEDGKIGRLPVSCGDKELEGFVNSIMLPCANRRGGELPVSAFANIADGVFPTGTSAFEKRGISDIIPEWISENCIQCNQCSFVCPHAVIRPAVLTKEELESAPEYVQKKAIACTGLPDRYFAVNISALDCTGCGCCANVCPGRKGQKALEMKTVELKAEQQEAFDYAADLSEKPELPEKFKPDTVKGSQFKIPLLEFSGACAGCGETPYAKLATQLFGDRMFIANATGCSSIWGASAPSIPYTKNKQGKGPAWANSLFEDNAEFGFGILLAQKTLRERAVAKILEIEKNAKSDTLKEACEGYLSTLDKAQENSAAAERLIEALKKAKTQSAQEALQYAEYLRKKSVWIFGGDGWAYDIGFSGLDHVLSSGEDINILVFDTELYSNTGGQPSKATPCGASAQLAANGVERNKKDLASMAMTYGNVYVASVAMGADKNQTVKALCEAEAYSGPSLIIAYAPCISHGIKDGMSAAQEEQKKAVESGYWQLFRYDPSRKAEGKNPFTLDSKLPTADYKDFLLGEERYSSLERKDPERAARLFDRAERSAAQRYEYLIRYAKLFD
ncbi:MAG: pyruvate:ferredoxin (flavodoxin) oxidoreductase [Oscillospiraceae bacterium]